MPARVRVDAGHHHDPAPQVGQGESRAILQDEGEVECRANPQEPGIGLPWAAPTGVPSPKGAAAIRAIRNRERPRHVRPLPERGSAMPSTPSLAR